MNREVRGALAGGGWKKAVPMPAQKKNLFYKSEFLYYRNKKRCGGRSWRGEVQRVRGAYTSIRSNDAIMITQEIKSRNP